MENDNPNSKDYWESRFATGHWERSGGFSQTAAFAHSQVARFDLDREFRGSIVDYGCGAGDAIPVYREAFPFADLTGVDFSRAAVDLAASRFGGMGRFIAGDASAVPVADVIVCSNVMEHLSDDEEIVSQLLGKCRTLFVTVPYRERLGVTSEHVRSYDLDSFHRFSPRWTKAFAVPGWSQFGWRLLFDVHLKNLVRPVLGRPRVRRAMQIMYCIDGQRVPGRGLL